jgi:hypothetical protein
MKYSRASVQGKTHALPKLKFDDHQLTSFAGLVILQKFFALIGLKALFRACFRHLEAGKTFSRATAFLQLVLHHLLGYRELRDCEHYRDDPLVQRLLGLKQLPGASTLSRMLKSMDSKSVEKLRALLRSRNLDMLRSLAPARTTLDFDGSVQSTKRHAEGTAVGFNKKKKGARSYYPLFCTVAQTDMVFDFLHRPGNVHDSNGAREFINDRLADVREALPHTRLETRVDSAFFSDEIITSLDKSGVEFTCSVPFERFVELKAMIEQRRHWESLNKETSYFETPWKPECWNRRFRFLFIRTRVKKQRKGPIQLDLFQPHENGYEFKVIVTNKTTEARNVVAFHGGRGSQEGIFGELKSQCNMGYVPVRTLCGNQTYLLAALFAYNLTRELQMHTSERARNTTAPRTSYWKFQQIDTIRKTLLQRAGRLTQPGGTLTLTISANTSLKDRILQMLAALDNAG